MCGGKRRCGWDISDVYAKICSRINVRNKSSEMWENCLCGSPTFAVLNTSLNLFLLRIYEMKIDECEGCDSYRQGICKAQDYDFRHISDVVRCPCSDCLVKTMCNSVCSDFDDIRERG